MTKELHERQRRQRLRADHQARAQPPPVPRGDHGDGGSSRGHRPLRPCSRPAPTACSIPSGKRGIILYTVRDAISRDPLTSTSRPASRRSSRSSATIGYKQIEFAGYSQNANSEGGSNLNNVEGATLLRSWLDENGLEAEGNHGSIPSTITDATIASFDTACEIANILGMGHIGTGSDPTGSAYVADWELAAERWNFFGARAASHGLKLYTHNHDIAYSFLLDSGPLDAQGRPTRSSGVRRLEHFLANTDPATSTSRWTSSGRTSPSSSTTPTPRPTAPRCRTSSTRRRRRGADHAVPAVPRQGRCEGPDAANGYVMTPFGLGDIDYATFFGAVGAKGYHNPMWEQDTAPGGTANPGQSLAFAQISYDNMAALRG